MSGKLKSPTTVMSVDWLTSVRFEIITFMYESFCRWEQTFGGLLQHLDVVSIIIMRFIFFFFLPVYRVCFGEAFVQETCNQFGVALPSTKPK